MFKDLLVYNSLMSVSKYMAILSGSALIAGTCIGAGMLAIPLATAGAGFFPGMLVSVLCWLLMLSTGYYLLEVSRWMPDGAHLLSMSEKYLGSWGKWIAGGAFLFLYYCLMVGYFAASGPLLVEVLSSVGIYQTPPALSFFLVFCVFFFIVFRGFQCVDKINWILFLLLVFSFFTVCGLSVFHVNAAYLQRQDWSKSVSCAPVLFGALGYHNVLPSLYLVMRRDIQVVRWSMVGGTFVALVVYVFWQAIVLGVALPEELAQNSSALSSIKLVQTVTGNRLVGLLGGIFAFLAIVTSLLGVSFAMVDFLADGLRCSRWGIMRFYLCALVFLPPAVLSVIYPGIFLRAIALAGGVGESILNVFLPVALFCYGVHRFQEKSSLGFLSHTSTVFIVLACGLLVFLIELVHLFYP